MNAIDTSVRTLIDAWKLMVGRLPAGKIDHSDGVAACIGHIPLPFLNLAAQDAPLPTPADFERFIDTALRRTADCPYPSMYVVCEDWAPGGWQAIAASHGLAPVMALTGMVAPELLPARRPAADLEIRRVADDAAARDLALVNAAGYEMPGEMFDCIGNMHLWHTDTFAFVGYSEGKPVSAAAALPLKGTVYIALVATVPEAQGKGFAETTFRHALLTAQESMGIAHSTLHASDMGQPLYRSMGYLPGARFQILAAGEH